MIKKYTALSFAFCALMVSSTVSRSEADTQKVAAKTQGITQLNLDTANPESATGKTTKQRIVSALAHTALLAPSLLYLVCAAGAPSSKISTLERLAFWTVGIRTSYGAVKGIYSAIAKSEVDPEKPATLTIYTATDSALCILALFLLRMFIKEPLDSTGVKILFLVPTVYSLDTSLKTIYKLAQNYRANSDAQKPEIQTITE